MYIGLHMKYPLLLFDFSEIWIFFGRFPKKFSSVRFHENPSSGSRANCAFGRS